MNLSRLMILGLLADRGPMHGHQIRRAGELTNAEVWGGITGGAADLVAVHRPAVGQQAEDHQATEVHRKLVCTY